MTGEIMLEATAVCFNGFMVLFLLAAWKNAVCRWGHPFQYIGIKHWEARLDWAAVFFLVGMLVFGVVRFINRMEYSLPSPGYMVTADLFRVLTCGMLWVAWRRIPRGKRHS